MRGRQIQLLKEVEHAPDADAVPVIAPGVIALLLRFAFFCRIPAGTFAIGIDLDVRRDAKGQPLSVGPGIVLALVDDRIVIAIVLGNRQHQMVSPSGSSPVTISAPQPKPARSLASQASERVVAVSSRSTAWARPRASGLSARQRCGLRSRPSG